MRFVSLLFFCMLSLPALADENVATASLERSWGLQLGDELVLTITMPEPDMTVDSSSLPQRDRRYGAWLHLNRIEQADNGLKMYFQLINVPIEKQALETPEFTVRTTEGQFVTVPGVPMTIGSMLAADIGELRAAMLKPDHAPVLLETQAARQQVQLALLVLVLTLLVLAGWHLGLRPRHRKPFANAVFHLFLMKWRGRKDADAATRLLHEAINQTAGTVIVHSHLQVIWDAAPWLEPLNDQIERFYQQSTAHFFAREAAGAVDFDEIYALTKACRAREKLA
ncbi:hypothetical protein MPL1_10097 [Methylophaga lonarensis MPL]|uniref:MxaA protein n=1 Tax=Methylophaga lonarensis MPL TaxID=1286106 RepID=M7NZ12_9GAMM|nr:hypothetical protein [Methylophaga lonarensis]EMR12451.1 hypothetical protein MPL1_10097 [Methylophaga lonarensis MPL]